MSYMYKWRRNKNRGRPNELQEEDDRKADVIEGDADHVKSVI